MSLLMASSTYDVASGVAVAVAAKAAWQPHPLCEPHLATELTNAVTALPACYFIPPCSGEQYDTPIEAVQRLNGYTLT